MTKDTGYERLGGPMRTWLAADTRHCLHRTKSPLVLVRSVALGVLSGAAEVGGREGRHDVDWCWLDDWRGSLTRWI